MSWLLNGAYVVALLALSPILVFRSWRDRKYRDGLAAKLFGAVPPRRDLSRPCIWFHAVSLGEVNALATVLDRVRQLRPDLELVISTTTQTGYAAAQRRYGQAHCVFYCPLDFTWAINRTLRRVRPDLLVLAELELWPNLIRLTRRHGAQVAMMNGRLSPRSYRGYRRIRWLTRLVLRDVGWIGCQTAAYAERFVALGASTSAVEVTGSVKFDGAQTERANPETVRLKQLAGIQASDTIWLAGSTCEPEERYVLDAFAQLAVQADLRLILVPRHPERFHAVAQLLDESGHAWARRSDLSNREVGDQPAWRILLVDCVGELSAWWGMADIGFVGGSMGVRGGQNMIEPSAYGVAVCFGPKTENFRDVVQQLLEVDAAQVVEDADALARFVGDCRRDPMRAVMLGERARKLVFSNMGATRRTVERIAARVPGPGVRRRRTVSRVGRKSA